MNKQILFLLLISVACAIECKSPRKKPGRDARPAAPSAKGVVKNTKPQQPAQNPVTIQAPQAPQPLSIPAFDPQPEVSKTSIRVKFSDKIVRVEKDQLDALNSRKVRNAPAYYNYEYYYGSDPIDLSFMDSKAFEFMQKLTALDAPKLFTFLNSTNKESFTLIREYANQLKIEGNFLNTCNIKMLQDPVLYDKNNDWIANTSSQYISYPFDTNGTTKYNYNDPRNVIFEYLGSDFWDKYKYDYNREDYSTYQNRMNVIYAVVAQINYHQGVFQKPAPLNTDFLKKAFIS